MHTANIILTLVTGLVATEPTPEEAAAPWKETSLAPGVNSMPGSADRVRRSAPRVAKTVPAMNRIRIPYDSPKILSPVILSNH